MSTPAKDGRTPLWVAAHQDHSDCVQFLKEAEEDQQRQATEEADRMMMLLLEEESEEGNSSVQTQRKTAKKGRQLKKAVIHEPETLDDDTVVDILNQRLSEAGSDWSSMSPARLRSMLANPVEAAGSGAGAGAGSGSALNRGSSITMSEKRLKGIKATVLKQQWVEERLASGEVDACTICFDGISLWVLQHGSTGHQCVCEACAARLHIGDKCTMCNQTIERICSETEVDRGN
jgi:hypothetical protein